MLKHVFLLIVGLVFITHAEVLTLQQGLDGYKGCIATDIRDTDYPQSLNEDGGKDSSKVTLAEGG